MSRPRSRRQRGFTLVEVLLATVLLAAGLTLAFATILAATRTADRGERMAEHSERIRAVEGFLRNRLAGARPIAFGFDQSTAMPLRFIGEPDRMRFVADLPDYLGRGGPYLHDIAIEDDGDDRRRLTLDLSVVQANQVYAEREKRPPEVLVDDLGEVRFRYRSLDADGGLGPWRDRWEQTEQLPLLVEVSLHDADGAPWPPVVVRLPLALFQGAALP